jgi:hypothetical protein
MASAVALLFRRKNLPGFLVEAHPPVGKAPRLFLHSDIVGYHIPKSQASDVRYKYAESQLAKQSKGEVR